MFSINAIRSTSFYVPMLSVIASVLLSGDVAQAALINHYQGEGNADDSVGGVHGDWIGNEAYGTGQVGQAFNFDGDTGADTGVEFTIPVIPTMGDWSILFWMKSNVPVTGLAVPVSQGHSNGDGVAFQFHSWNRPVFTVAGFNAEPSLFNDTYQFEAYTEPDTLWHHVALTHDSTTSTNTMYLDGGLADAQIYNESRDPNPVDMPDSTWQSPFTNTPGNPTPMRFGDDVHNGNRNWNGLLDEVQIHDNVLSESEIQNICQCDPPADPTEFTWTADGVGDWSVGSNWAPGNKAPPNTNLETAIFGINSSITKPTVAVVTSPVTVNRVEFDNAISYGIGGLETLTLQGSSETPSSSVHVNQGSHQFQVEVSLDSDTDVFVQSGSSLAFNLPLNLNGNTLAKTGDGTMAINNNLTTNGGSVDCQGGTCSGDGTIGGDLNNSGGIVAPGNSPGILTIDGDYTQGSGGTLAIEIGGLAVGDEHDQLNVLGNLDLDGTLEVTLIDGFSPVDGNTFDILNFSSATIQPGLNMVLPAGMWDTSMLGVTGELIFGIIGVRPDGDFNEDNIVDANDLNLVLFNWNNASEDLPANWTFMRPADGAVVDSEELNKVLFTWNQTFPSTAAVPEPGSLALGVIALLFVSASRWRRK